MLDTAWSLLPAAAYAAVVVTRTALEDQFLHDNLPGYGGYAVRVPERLLPGLW